MVPYIILTAKLRGCVELTRVNVYMSHRRSRRSYSTFPSPQSYFAKSSDVTSRICFSIVKVKLECSPTSEKQTGRLRTSPKGATVTRRTLPSFPPVISHFRPQIQILRALTKRENFFTLGVWGRSLSRNRVLAKKARQLVTTLLVPFMNE